VSSLSANEESISHLNQPYFTFVAPYYIQQCLLEISELIRTYLQSFSIRENISLQILILDSEVTDSDFELIGAVIDNLIKSDFYFFNTSEIYEHLCICQNFPSDLDSRSCAIIKTISVAENNCELPHNIPVIQHNHKALLDCASHCITHSTDQASSCNESPGISNDFTNQTINAWETALDNYYSNRRLSDFPPYAESVNKYISGSKSITTHQHIANRIQTLPFKRNFLSIGCGEGSFEFSLLEIMPPPERFDAFDLVPAVIEKAKQRAQKLTIPCLNFFVKDASTLSLPVNNYDVIFANSSLHHIHNLERVFWEVSRSLTETGIFIACEYVGPAHLQLNLVKQQMIEKLIQNIPLQLRKSFDKPGFYKTSFTPLPLEFMIANDYSEGIRSDEISRLLHKFFTVIEEKEFGSMVIQFLFINIENNFDPKDKTHMDVVQSAIDFETDALRRGIISHDYKYFVCVPKHFALSVNI
jgi:ubiquinone/menaquinone biosynthesis C-methylase UbiE